MTFILQNDALRMEFDQEYGTLIGLTAHAQDWHILERPTAGLSFHLLVPLPGRRNNRVLGEHQRLTTLTVQDDHHAIFVWDHLTSQHGGSHAMRVQLAITLSEEQAMYAMTIENQSALTIENVWCPYLADVQSPPASPWLRAYVPTYSTADIAPLRPTYHTTRGYWGIDSPTQLVTSPFLLLLGEQQGFSLHMAAAEPALVAWHTELRPGYQNAMGEQVPTADTIGDRDVTLRCAAVHVPYIAPGETRQLTQIALAPFLGGWEQGAACYRTWRSTWMTPALAPAWARAPHAWQQIQFNTPEDDLRYTFQDLVSIGEECAQQGVKAIQLVGWNVGGQDQGNPSHTPDPRLGTVAEFQSAIRQVQSLGVKIILFAKFTWADRATERYRTDLVRYAIKDPYGDPYYHQGYQYQTATQLLDINTKRFAPMCFLSEDYLQVCETEFRTLLALGAAGMLYDESQHHSPALLCFAEDHGHRRGAFVYANDDLLIKRFRKLSAAAGQPDFLFAGESCADHQFAVYDLSYLRSASRDHLPMTRFLHPHVQMMTAVAGFDDRNMLNQCLLYRYIISYEPFNFKGRLADFPLTVAYGRQVDALRTTLRDYFWDGEFCHEAGVRVTTNDGQLHHPYAVYRRENDHRIGVALANYDAFTVIVQVAQAIGAPLARYRLVDHAEWQPFEGSVVLPPYSAAVLLPTDEVRALR